MAAVHGSLALSAKRLVMKATPPPQFGSWYRDQSAAHFLKWHEIHPTSLIPFVGSDKSRYCGQNCK